MCLLYLPHQKHASWEDGEPIRGGGDVRSPHSMGFRARSSVDSKQRPLPQRSDFHGHRVDRLAHFHERQASFFIDI